MCVCISAPFITHSIHRPSTNTRIDVMMIIRQMGAHPAGWNPWAKTMTRVCAIAIWCCAIHGPRRPPYLGHRGDHPKQAVPSAKPMRPAWDLMGSHLYTRLCYTRLYYTIYPVYIYI